ncbi:TonB3 protein [Oleiphilus messinensis]|uniref:Protein TonB n=1 Tax=Oleiphilus messinensis TaxID=141451 RepID=A0A1Y0IBJ0_9GAMM|nr:energy transducer TonB [Oleiphilus messinensis]ARU57878.1 TonB3 protein [Oleiphilus messinensis]
MILLRQTSKLSLFLLTSTGIVFILFLFMSQLVDSQVTTNLEPDAKISLQLHRMRFDSEIQTRERQKPEPPELEDVTEQQDLVAPPKQTLKLGVPDVAAPNVPSNINLALDLGSLDGQLAGLSMDTTPSIEFELTMAPVTRVNPMYPLKAKRRRIEGKVVVEFIVDEEGRVEKESLKFIESTPPGFFESNVKRAILRWRFNPLVKGGQATPFRTRQTLEFKMQS